MESEATYLRCQSVWGAKGFVGLADLFALAQSNSRDVETEALRLCLAFNGGMGALAALRKASRNGDVEAANVLAWMAVYGMDKSPARPLSPDDATACQQAFDADPEDYIAARKGPYPFRVEEAALGFSAEWVTESLRSSAERLDGFVSERRSDVALLVGNGPSLKKVDPASLSGQDVFISNYAIKHPEWRALARGLAVTNRLVAEQEPYLFQLPEMWKFHPIWLGHTLRDTPKTIWLNAIGGPLFFSPDLRRRVAWHATVSFFWLQILYHAGYKRVVMIGFDNSYQQPKGLPEGTLLHQEGDDPNHFDPGYFRGKTWQAADTNHMSQTYQLARGYYEASGREIINSTVGGKLEDLPRMPLADALLGRPV